MGTPILSNDEWGTVGTFSFLSLIAILNVFLGIYVAFAFEKL